MQINESIFKAYDFRGIYPEELNEEIMELVGRAFVQFLGVKKVLVGRDMRLSSDKFAEAFIAGANKQGADIIDLGLISSDCLYFASGKYNLSGVMITASHNPKEYNGIKFCRENAVPISNDTGLRDIKKLVVAGQFQESSIKGKIELNENILDEFAEHCLTFIETDKIKPLKICVDAGNGMAGKIIPAVFKILPCEIIPLYFELDGDFPNHAPNPMEKANNEDLANKIREEKADLGLSFDGDADRVFFLDESGNMIDSSWITAMIAKKFLESHPSETILYNVAVSKAVPDIVAKMGGTSMIVKVGHSFIKDLMKSSGAIFAGEHSGHYFFRDNYRADSGIIAALIVIQMISESGVPFSELIKEFQLYCRIPETNSIIKDKDAVIARLKEKYGQYLTQDFDGASFDLGSWRFIVRPSNTEPAMRLNLEADSEELMNEKVEEVLKLIRE